MVADGHQTNRAYLPEELAARIRALRERTVERGCTEAEAVAAAGLLSQLLEKYGVTLEELERINQRGTRPGTGFEGVSQKGRRNLYAFEAETAIASLFDVVYVGPASRSFASVAHLGAPIYFGLHADVAAAVALAEIVHAALKHSWSLYRRDKPPPSSNEAEVARRSFQCAMAMRLRQRFETMQKAHRAAKNALVVLKAGIVKAAAHDAGVIGVGYGQWPPGTVWDKAAMNAGWAAANVVALGAGAPLSHKRTRCETPTNQSQRVDPETALQRERDYQAALAAKRAALVADFDRDLARVGRWGLFLLIGVLVIAAALSLRGG
ncbi:DUF2786 domain-containing protein [Candidatus Viadribacter manganicus]|uniref:DUF7168 domain-containing protein n=1 Tax=Candidatus Viadribacter manganicus TaxID=1759059 RepID=A0A1B1AHN7_9PROT|nr:DUF2786 domain-containing protein [Candidatus Viadribacter manganicus]ANP46065.1 hypothetical protein ATE48_09095 [Candidatus Viadribacter manganicus]